MRSLKWIAAIGLVVGCTARPMSVVTDVGTSSLDDLLRARPLAAGTNIRADEIARTPAASVHLVQVSERRAGRARRSLRCRTPSMRCCSSRRMKGSCKVASRLRSSAPRMAATRFLRAGAWRCSPAARSPRPARCGRGRWNYGPTTYWT